MGLARTIARASQGWYATHWFAAWLAVRILAVAALAHWYDSQVFTDAAVRLASGHGVYAVGGHWRTSSFNAEGYYTYPPVYAYLLGLSAGVSRLISPSALLLQSSIKLWLFASDILTYVLLRSVSPRVAKSYWTLWFVPVLAIASMQSDVIAGLLVLIALLLARGSRHVGAAVALGIGAATKYVPLLIVPFVCAYFLRRHDKRTASTYALFSTLAFAASWLPYALIYPDASQFADALSYQTTRIGGGLNSMTLFHFLVFALGTGNLLLGPTFDATSYISTIPLLTRIYSGVLVAIAGFVLWRYARSRSPTLEQAFVLPFLVFLFAAPVVNEQFLLMVLPIVLLLRPQILKRILLPFSVYVLAAGTPLRFLPPQLGGDVILALLTGEVATVLIPIILVSTTICALAFNFRIGGSIVHEFQSDHDPAEAPSSETPRGRRRSSVPQLMTFIRSRASRVAPYVLSVSVVLMAAGAALLVGVRPQCPVSGQVLSVGDPLSLGAGSGINLEAKSLADTSQVLSFAAVWPGLSIEEPWIATDPAAALPARSQENFSLIPLRASGAIPSGISFSLKIYVGSFDRYCTTPPLASPNFSRPLLVNPWLLYWSSGMPFGWSRSSEGDPGDVVSATGVPTAGTGTILDLSVDQDGPRGKAAWAEIRVSQLVLNLPSHTNMSVYPTFDFTYDAAAPTSAFGLFVEDGVNRLWFVFTGGAGGIVDYSDLRVVSIHQQLNVWSSFELNASDVAMHFAQRGWTYHPSLDFGFFVFVDQSQPGPHEGMARIDSGSP